MVNYKKKRRIKQFLYCGMLIVAVLLASLPMPVNAEEKEDKPQVMVSLGDSFSSGEGIEPFYGQNEDDEQKVQNPDWLAHRSQYSWSSLLTLPSNDGTMMENKDKYWYFVAASGAVADNLKYTFSKEYKKGKYKGQYNLNPQLDIFNQIEENTVDYVTITIGGNDVGFADIITSCVTGSKYLNFGGLSDKLNNTWKTFYANGGTKDKIRDAYNNIAEKAGGQANIIVAGYPQLLDKEGKGFFIGKPEAEEVNENVSKFNAAIEEIVTSCKIDGMNIDFVSVEEAFDGHEAYSEEPYINKIIFLAKKEDLKDFQITSAYSMHPNEQGAEAYARCVQAKIDEIEEQKESDNSMKNDLTSNPEATDKEMDAKAKHFSGIVIKPEDVVLKMFDALQEGDYELAAECLDPATERQFDFWGGIASTLVGFFTGEYLSWGQLVLEAAGATDVEVIDCYSEKLIMENNIDIISEWLPKIPGLRNLICTEADVCVKFRYKYNDETYTIEETYHVRRYDWSGWRIEEGY